MARSVNVQTIGMLLQRLHPRHHSLHSLHSLAGSPEFSLRTLLRLSANYRTCALWPSWGWMTWLELCRGTFAQADEQDLRMLRSKAFFLDVLIDP